MQRPDWQVAPAAQRMPQTPQLAMSLEVLTQLREQLTRPSPQPLAQLPWLHTCSPLQTAVQLPQ